MFVLFYGSNAQRTINFTSARVSLVASRQCKFILLECSEEQVTVFVKLKVFKYDVTLSKSQTKIDVNQHTRFEKKSVSANGYVL